MLLHNFILIVSLALALVGVACAAKSGFFRALATVAMAVFLLALVHLI